MRRGKKMWKHLAGLITMVLTAGAVGNTAMAANLIAAVSSDPHYSNNDVGTLTGSRVTTDVDVDSAGWRIKRQDGDTAVFNFHYKGKSYLLTRYGRSGKSRFSDAQGNWLALNDNAAGHFVYHNSTPNIHEITYNDGFVYVTGYDNPHISVAKLEGDNLNNLNFQKAADYTNDIVHNFRKVEFHGEGIAIRGNDLYALVTANPNGGYESYADSYVLKYKMNSDGSLSHEKGKDVVRVGKNSTEIEPYNNLLMIPSMGGMLVSGEASPNASLDIVDISGGRMKTHRVKVPEAVGLGKTTEARNMHVTPEGNVYVLVGAYANDFHGSTGGVWKTTVSNLMSDNPLPWTKITDFEAEKDGGYNWDVYAEENPRRVWVNAGNKIKLYIDGKETPIVFPIEKFGSSKEKIYVNMDGFTFLAPAQVAGEAPNQARLLDISDNETMLTGEDKSIYTYTTNAVLGPEADGAGDLKSNVAAGVFARDYGDITLEAKEKALTINADTGVGTPVGIYAGNGKNVTVNAKKLTVNTNSPTGGETKTSAIWLDAAKDKAGKITINAPLHIEMTGGEGGYGIAVKKTDRWGEAAAESTAASEIVVNGDVSLTGTEGRQWGLPVNHKNVYGRLNNAGLYTAVDKSKITINGSVDLAVHGNGATALSKDSEINVKGGKITVPTGKNYAYYALAAYDGTVRMNTGSDGKTPGAEKVDITGDLYAGKNGKIDIAMTTEDSALRGIVNSAGTVRAYLQNGATWVNEKQNTPHEDETEDVGSRGKSRLSELIGGSEDKKAGWIVQRDGKGISIDTYSGHTKVIYSHDGNLLYEAGDVTIVKALPGSQITLRTDNNGIDTSDEDITRTALNTLAGKLVYGSYPRGERNLNGKVEIAEGLTAASASIKIGDISFSESTGVGGYGGLTPVEPPEEERIDAPIVETTSLKTGHTVNAVDADATGGVVAAVYHDPSSLTVENVKKVAELLKAAKAKEVEANNSTDEEEIHRLLMESAELNKQADKICDSMKGVDVDVNYHDLVLNSTAKKDGQTAAGIYLFSKVQTRLKDMKDEGLIDEDIYASVENKFATLPSFGSGIKLSATRPEGYVDIKVKNDGDGNAYGVLKNKEQPVSNSPNFNLDADLRFDVEAAKGDAIGVDLADGLYHSKARPEKHIFDFRRIRAENGRAIGYWVSKAAPISSFPRLRFGEEIHGGKGSVGLYVTGENVQMTIGGTDVDGRTGGITGGFDGHVVEMDAPNGRLDINVADIDMTGKDGYALVVRNGSIVSGLDTCYKGNIFITKESEDKKPNLYMSFHEWHGVMDNQAETDPVNIRMNGSQWHNKKVGRVSEGFAGSKVFNFSVSGKDNSLFMEDEKPLEVLNRFSGVLDVYYAHDENNAKIIKGGDLVINKAGANSMVSFYTDANGIDFTKDNAVNDVLNALAHKMVYKGYTDAGGKERNLALLLGIKEGLTSQSAIKEMQLASFNETDGRGYYRPGEIIENGPIRTDTVLTKDTITCSDTKTALFKSRMISPISPKGSTLTVEMDGYNLRAEAVDADTPPDLRVSGVYAGTGQTVTINNKKETGLLYLMTEKSSSSGGVLHAEGESSRIEINTPVTMEEKGSRSRPFIYADGKNSTVTVNGLLNLAGKMKTDDILLDARNGGTIRISDFNINTNTTLTKTERESEQGGKAVGRIILGGGDYNIIDQDPFKAYTDASSGWEGRDKLIKKGGKLSGNVSINMEPGGKAEAGNRRVRMITGIDEADSYRNEPGMRIGLRGKDSWWINNKDHTDWDWTYRPSVELSITDGARLFMIRSLHVSDLHGGFTAQKAGKIYSLNYPSLWMKNYEGYTEITDGGATVVRAEPGSGIVLRKDISGLDWEDGNVRVETMYNTAQSLSYYASLLGENHLKARLEFVRGKADDAPVAHTEEVVLDPASGRGWLSLNYKVPSVGDQPAVFYQGMGALKKNTETKKIEDQYLDAGVLVRPGEYVFRKDAEIRGITWDIKVDPQTGEFMKDPNTGDYIMEQKEIGTDRVVNAGGAIGLKGDVLIDMAGHSLSAHDIRYIVPEDVSFSSPIAASRGYRLEIRNPGKIYLHGVAVDKKKDHAFAFVSASMFTGADGVGNPWDTRPDIHIKNDTDPAHALTLRNTGQEIDPEYAFHSIGIYTKSQVKIRRPVIRVDGLVDIEFTAGRGLMTADGNITIGGGRILTPGNYAVYAGGMAGPYVSYDSNRGIINVNVTPDGEKYVPSGNPVQIEGHIATNDLTTVGQYLLGYTEDSGIVNLALDRPDSYWKGRAFSTTKAVLYRDMEGGWDGKERIEDNGKINLFLANGATWTNEGEMDFNKEYHSGMKSSINILQGGSSEADRGIIHQKDTNDIQIRSLRGHVLAFFDRDPTEVEKILGGSIEITSTVSEQDGSHASMTLRTDSAGLTMSDTAQVDRVLGNLAKKLVYKGYPEGGRTLDGSVEIAEGLTSQSVKTSGYIAFDHKTGMGILSKTKPVYEARVGGPISSSVLIGEKKEILVNDHDNILFYNAGIYNGTDKPAVIDLAGHGLKINTETTETWSDGYLKKLADSMPSYTLAGIVGLEGTDTRIINGKDAKVTIGVTGFEQQSVYGIVGEADSHVSVDADFQVNALTIQSHKPGAGYDRAEAAAVLAKGKNSDIRLRSLHMDKEATTHVYKFDPFKVPSGKASDAATPRKLLDGTYAFGLVARGENSRITIGDIGLDLQGTGVKADGANSEIRIGGGKLTVIRDETTRLHVLEALNGTIYAGMNEAGTDASGEDLAVKGNIMARANQGEKGIIHLGLGSDKSSWSGVVDAEYMKGDVNLYLKKGGTWTNQAEDLVFEPYHYKGSYVTNLSGGHTAEEAGIIFQKEDKPITVENYQGYTKIFYEHDIADPTRIIGGDFIVKNALKREDKNAVVEVITDRSGLDIHSEEDVEKTLDSLAHKLVYTGYVAGERNMDACAFIAEGLTAQSAAKWFGNVKFTDTEGRGTIEKAEKIYPESQVENPMTTPIDGSKESEDAYSEAGIYKKNDDEYRFTKDPAGIHIEKTPSAAIIASEKDITVKAQGGLEIISSPEGICAGEGKTAAITAKEVSVKVEDGHAVKADNGTVNITGNLATEGKDGIKAENNGAVTVTGKVDITAEDKAAEALAGSKINLNGGGFMQGKVRADKGAVSGEGIAVRGDITADNGGSVTFNGGKVGSDLVSGNGTGSRIELIGGGYSIKMLKADNGGIITLKTNPDSLSEIKGIHSGEDSAVNVTVEGGNSKLIGDVTGTGAVKLDIGNNGTWTGKSSNENTDATVNSTWKNTGETKLKKLGGSGTVDMTQSGEGKTEIKEYNGTLTLIYAHENANPVNMKGNNFHIGKAAEGSKIRMLTDNAGLNTSSEKAADKNQVSAALNALAGKLYYEAYVAGEKNLEGTVEIAEGLTAQSATKRLETMTYKAETGQGQFLYTPATVDDPTPPNPKPPIIYGDKETQMMKGAKTAMTSAVLLWRGNNNDLQRRMGDIRLAKEENGIWARYLGGKNKMDKQNTYLKQTYDIAQVGYDKKKGNWTIGAALDYGTGKDTYTNGTGKGKLASLALYGTMQKEDGQYIDVILKGSRVKNDYTVYNEMNHRLEGKYRTNGLSLSMEYGKRMKKENGFYIDPSIELTAGHLGGKDYDAVSDMGGNKKMHIHQDGVTSVIGRIGLGIGKETERSNLFAKIALAHEFGGKVKSIFSAENEPTSGTEVDLKDSWVDVEVGGSWLVNRNTYLYGTYTRNFGADVSSKWRIDAGIRFSF